MYLFLPFKSLSTTVRAFANMLESNISNNFKKIVVENVKSMRGSIENNEELF